MKKRLLPVLLALVLVLAMAVVPAHAYALVRPTSHTQVSSLTGISSVTVNGTAAYYEQDSNTNAGEYFIRALLPKTSATEYTLKHATVVITTTGAAASIPGYTASVSGNQYTFTGVNLFNTKYTVTVGTYNYVLAAGIEDGQVGISNSDVLKLSGTLASTSLSVYGINEQNPYMGNPYYSGWTYIDYYVAATLPTGTNLSNVSGTFYKVNGPTFNGGGKTGTGPSVSGPFNFTSYPNITITSGTSSRVYHTRLAVTGSTVNIGTGGNCTYGINMSEVIGSSYYTGTVKDEVDAILFAWNAYVSQVQPFSSNTSVMDVMEAFITWASTTDLPDGSGKYFTGTSDTGGGYYLSSLNGLAAFDCGDNSGYMYTDDANGYYWNSTTDHSHIATVGADGMLITNGGSYIWFYTIDYMNWISWKAE